MGRHSPPTDRRSTQVSKARGPPPVQIPGGKTEGTQTSRTETLNPSKNPMGLCCLFLRRLFLCPTGRVVLQTSSSLTKKSHSDRVYNILGRFATACGTQSRRPTGATCESRPGLDGHVFPQRLNLPTSTPRGGRRNPTGHTCMSLLQGTPICLLVKNFSSSMQVPQRPGV